MLEATAKIMATPRVTAGELISEGWYVITRKREDPSYMMYDLKREMFKYICRCVHRREQIAFEERMALRNANEFEQWLKNRKFKLQR